MTHAISNYDEIAQYFPDDEVQTLVDMVVGTTIVTFTLVVPGDHRMEVEELLDHNAFDFKIVEIPGDKFKIQVPCFYRDDLEAFDALVLYLNDTHPDVQLSDQLNREPW